MTRIAAASAATVRETSAAGDVSRRQTFVLVHGAWHGGWCWARVANRLQRAGHRVLTPTLTGLGERRHLLSKDITLDTFMSDVAGVIEAEEVSDIVLVGHSFGGSAISGVADRMPERVRHLVYLDALIVEPGKTAFDALSADDVAARLKLADESSGGLSLPAPLPDAFGVTDPDDALWLKRRLTPQPLSTYTSRLPMDGPIGSGLPCTYIGCIAPIYAALDGSRTWAKNQAAFRYIEMPASHDAMVTASNDLTRVLMEIAGLSFTRRGR